MLSGLKYAAVGCLCAGTAQAQYTYDLRFVSTAGFGSPNAGIADGTVLDGVIIVDGAATGNFDIFVQARVNYDAGTTGEGVASWDGEVLVNGFGDSGEPAFVFGANQAPYTGTGSQSGTAVDDDAIDTVGVVPALDDVAWPVGGPEPTQPSWAGQTGGNGGWVNMHVLRFQFLDNATIRDINFSTDTFEGRALTEQGWAVAASTPPGFGPGVKSFIPVALPDAGNGVVTEAGFTLRVPAPTSLALLGMGMFGVAGRRRSSYL